MIYNENMNNELLKDTLGELIGLINGCYKEDIDIELEIYEIMDLLNINHIDEAYKKVIAYKTKYLGVCMACKSPCGNSSKYTVTDDQLQKYRNLKRQYSRDMNYTTLCQMIVDIVY